MVNKKEKVLSSPNIYRASKINISLAVNVSHSLCLFIHQWSMSSRDGGS